MLFLARWGGPRWWREEVDEIQDAKGHKYLTWFIRSILASTACCHDLRELTPAKWIAEIQRAHGTMIPASKYSPLNNAGRSRLVLAES